MNRPEMSALWLERLALGELQLTDAALAERGLDRAEVEAAVAALRRDDEHFDGRLPPALRELELQPAATNTPWMWAAAAVVALGVGLAWWASRSTEAPVQTPIAVAPGPTDGDRIKGDTRLYVTRQEAGEPVELHDRDAAQAGDLLQLAYRAGKAESGVIVSIDGAGAATLHFPATESETPQLDRRGRVALDHAFELDAAPGFERFFFVTSAPGEQLRVTDVLEAARKLAQSDDAMSGELELPPAWHQSSLRLDKSR